MPALKGAGVNQKVKRLKQPDMFATECDYSRADSYRTVHSLATAISAKPYCSSNLSQGLSIRAKYDALEHSSIQINTPWCIKYIVLDIDEPIRPEWPLKPTLYTLNPENDHYHVYIQLETPVLIGDNANPHPQRWLKQIISRLITMFGADPNYAGLVAKNPLHTKWIVGPGKGRWITYSLKRLEKVVRGVPEAVKLEFNESPEGRNCTVFDALRVWAYRQVHGFANVSPWDNHVLAQCLEINKMLSDPLGYGECIGISKSVSKYCWLNRDKIGRSYIHRGAMGYGVTRHDSKEMPYLDSAVIAEHRYESAFRTAQIKRENAEGRIIEAIGQLVAQNQRVTKAAVARMLGLHRKTLQQYYSHLFTK
jgi:hypothetical protein